MKKFAGLNLFMALLMFSVAIILFSHPAQAYVYDHFTSSGINPSLWYDPTPETTGLFSQPGDSFLYFNDNVGGQADRLISSNPVSGAFTVVMQFSNFLADNNTTAGAGLGSCVQLRLEEGGNIYSVHEFKNAGGQNNPSGLGFQAVSVIGGTWTSLAWNPTTVTSGWLRIDYNGITGLGGEVVFWYDDGSGWTMLTSVAPNFSQAPYFSIRGNDLHGSSLSFQVDQVQVIPLPASVLLLGTGLLSLAGWRRFRKS